MFLSSFTESRGEMMSEPKWSYTRTFHTGSVAVTAPRGRGWFRFSIRFREAEGGRRWRRGRWREGEGGVKMGEAGMEQGRHLNESLNGCLSGTASSIVT